MKLNLKKPLALFDLETTGIDIANDRIVEISIVKVFPDGTQEIKTERVNPEMPIPIETSMIHGIYDEDIKDKPTFREIAKDIANFIEGCDLGGYNLLRFDVPLLAEEFLRVGVDYEFKNSKIVDAQRIFHLMEPRTLSAAYKFYCGESLENAHSAEADTLATYEVLKAQLDRYKGQVIKDKDGNEITPIVNDMPELDALNITQNVDLLGRIVYNKDKIPVFNFGKNKGVAVTKVLTDQPHYYDWMMKSDFPLYTKKILTQLKLNMLTGK